MTEMNLGTQIPIPLFQIHYLYVIASLCFLCPFPLQTWPRSSSKMMASWNAAQKIESSVPRILLIVSFTLKENITMACRVS